MAAFYGWRSIASRLEPLRGGSLLFTNKFPQISGTHFTDLGRMKGWVDLGATQRFWTQDPWIGNRAPWPLGHCSINKVCIFIFLLAISTEIIASNYILFWRWTLERVKLFCWTQLTKFLLSEETLTRPKKCPYGSLLLSQFNLELNLSLLNFNMFFSFSYLPPVAIRSSRTTTFCPGFNASHCISNVSLSESRND